MPRRHLAASILICLCSLACSDEDPTSTSLVARIEILAPADSLIVGDTVQLSATLTNGRGAVLEGRTPTWSSSDPAIAAVSGSGQVVARAVGQATIRAEVDGLSASANVHVLELSCARTGTSHTGFAPTEVWAASKSPHHVRDTLTVSGQATVTVEPGALVCLAPGSVILVTTATLRAVGTPEKPIRFTATDPARPWDRIKFGALVAGRPEGGTGVFTDVLFEFATYGIQRSQPGDVTIESSRFRQMRNGAIHDDIGGTGSAIPGRLILRNSVIDTAGDVRLAAGVFENSVIRGGGGLILSANARFGGPIDVLGGRIEGSTSVAVRQEVSGPYIVDAQVREVRPLRIVDSRGKLVSMRAGLFQRLWPTPPHQDSLLGNPDGVIELFAHSPATSFPRTSTGLVLVLRREFTWHFAPSRCSSNTCVWLPVDDLVLEPGTTVQVTGTVLEVFRRFSAPGTAERPISISAVPHPSGVSTGGISLLGTSQASSASYVTLNNVYLRTDASHALTLSRINSNWAVLLESAGSSIIDSDLHNTSIFPLTPEPAAALKLGAGTRMERTTVRGQRNGVVISGPGVTLQTCDVVGNTGDGIHVITDASSVRVRDCNIQGNLGVGLNNTATQTIDARDNWWGDPAGPNGPNGNRVSGSVDFSGWLTQARAPLGSALQLPGWYSRSVWPPSWVR